jgi:acyl-CoA thioesterase FadM
MNLFLRLFAVVISVAFRRRLKVNDVSQITLLVLPNDVDLNFHMNNGRYMTLLDLGRLDFLIRTGLGPVFLRNKWQPQIGGTLIRYRFGLRPFERFRILTRILCWDEKWFATRIHLPPAESLQTFGPSRLPLEASVRKRTPAFPQTLVNWDHIVVAESFDYHEQHLFETLLITRFFTYHKVFSR